MNEKIPFSLEPMPGKAIVIEDGFEYRGRLTIPDHLKRRPTTGKVVAIGPEVTTVEVGDHIVYGQWTGTVIDFKGQPAYRILAPEEILAKIHGEAELSGTST